MDNAATELRIALHKSSLVAMMISVCVEMDDENWENTFLEELTAKAWAKNETEDASQEMDKEDDEFDDDPVVPKLKTYKEAINSLEDDCQFWSTKDMELKPCPLVSLSIILLL